MLDFMAGVPGKLKTLNTNITALLAKITANVDVNVSTRAAASTAVSNADLTAARAAKLDFLTGVPLTSAIQSIQHVAASLLSTDTSKAVTITAVDTAKTIIIPLGVEAWSMLNLWAVVGRWSLTSSTVVTFTRPGNYEAIAVGCIVVEFK